MTGWVSLLQSVQPPERANYFSITIYFAAKKSLLNTLFSRHLPISQQIIKSFRHQPRKFVHVLMFGLSALYCLKISTMSQKCQQSRNKNGEQWLACHLKGSFVLQKKTKSGCVATRLLTTAISSSTNQDLQSAPVAATDRLL